MREDFPADNEQTTDLEAQVDWNGARRARRSMNNGNCVEVATGEGVVGFRDSKRTEDRFAVGAEAAAIFLADVKAGLYDL